MKNRKAMSWRFKEETIAMIGEIAKMKKWGKIRVMEQAIQDFYDKNIGNNKPELESSTIKVGDKYFKVTMLTSIEIGPYNDPAMSVEKIFADEDMQYKEFSYKNGDLIYDADSADQSKSKISNTILKYQNVDDIPE